MLTSITSLQPSSSHLRKYSSFKRSLFTRRTCDPRRKSLASRWGDLRMHPWQFILHQTSPASSNSSQAKADTVSCARLTSQTIGTISTIISTSGKLMRARQANTSKSYAQFSKRKTRTSLPGRPRRSARPQKGSGSVNVMLNCTHRTIPQS